ncbi:RNA 2',3'-cyclic phosphodiesterase [Patescibacteria group bacterium]
MPSNKKQEKKRIFVAVQIPAVVKKEVKELIGQELLKNKDIKLVRPENWHLTLQFLGDLSDKEVKGAKKALKALAESYKLFNLYVESLELYPRENMPRVVALQLKDHSALMDVQAAVAKALEKWTSPEAAKQQFRPHISILRLKPDVDIAEVQELLAEPYERRFEVPDIVLYSSVLEETGAVHTEEARFELLPDE